MTEQATATSTPAAAPAAEAAPQSALAAGAKSENVESMLVSAAKAAAQEPEAHDRAKLKVEDYAKVKVEGVGDPVMKAGIEACVKHNIPPDVAQELISGLAKAQGEFRSQSEKQQIEETDAAWEKEWRENKDIGGDKFDRSKRELEAEFIGVLGEADAKRAKEIGLMSQPLVARMVLAARARVMQLTKQDSTAVGGSQGGAGSESEQWAKANAKTVAGLKAIGIKV